MLRKIICCLVAVVSVACDEEKDRQEVIAKLRPLGVATAPIIATPDTPVSLTFHNATPPGTTLTYTAESSGDRFGSTVPIHGLVIGAETVEDFASFSHHKVAASFMVPSAEILGLVAGQSRRLRYNVVVASPSESATIVGDVMVFAAGTPEASWGGVTAKITNPNGELGVKAEVAMEGELIKPTSHTEDYKIGWFVGGGEVKNRRARETIWTTPETAGTYTVVLTARGKLTKAFSIEVKDVTVQ